jgi:hypothetical protein
MYGKVQCTVLNFVVQKLYILCGERDIQVGVLPQMLLGFVNHESRLLLLCQERNHFMENACGYRSL